MKLTFTYIYCFVCRWFFEYSGVIGAYFFLHLKWAILITVLFVLWQALSVRVYKQLLSESLKSKTDYKICGKTEEVYSD